MNDLKIGLLVWNQNTDWNSLLQTGVRADKLGYESLWAWDHVYPIVGEPYGPFYEGWLTITAWAMATSKVKVGLMVGANPYRNPALVAKMASTLDHISGGRAYLGIGAAWFEGEAHDYGYEFGSGPGERLRWLGEALPIIRGMLDGKEPTATGPHYHSVNTRNDPLPVQKHLPILVGGGGEKVTLRLVAQYADACNLDGDIETIRRKEAILREHCQTVGRDEREIERTLETGIVVIRDSHAEAEKVLKQLLDNNKIRKPDDSYPIGTPEEAFEQLAPYVELGYRHLIVDHPAPYDEETETRLAREVGPKLEALS